MNNTNLNAQSDPNLHARIAQSQANRFVSLFPEFSSLDDPSVQGTLDYTRNSLLTLDSWIESMRPWAGEASLIRAFPHRRNLFIGCGFYFGETIIRNLGGQWCHVQEMKALGLPMGAFAAPVVIGLNPSDVGRNPRFTTYADPIGRIFRRLFNGAEDGLLSFYDYLAARAQNHH